MDLPERERKALEYIKKCIAENGFAPSVRDLQNALGIKSTSTVHLILSRLEEAGEITREKGKSRTLTVEGHKEAEKKNERKIPLLGKVTAGLPILAEENLEGYVEFPLSDAEAKYNSYFALRVSGESMIEAGILDGDILIVEKASYAENGAIVVVGVGDEGTCEATCKRFFRENGHYRLQPENSSMKPIICENAYIIGIVKASFRLYSRFAP